MPDEACCENLSTNCSTISRKLKSLSGQSNKDKAPSPVGRGSSPGRAPDLKNSSRLSISKFSANAVKPLSPITNKNPKNPSKSRSRSKSQTASVENLTHNYSDRHCAKHIAFGRRASKETKTKISNLTNLPIKVLEDKPKYKISNDVFAKKNFDSQKVNCSQAILSHQISKGEHLGQRLEQSNEVGSESLGEGEGECSERVDTLQSGKEGSEVRGKGGKLVTVDVKEGDNPLELAKQMIVDKGLKWSQLDKLESCIRAFQVKMFPH